MILTKSCPRCHGDMYREEDPFGEKDLYREESRIEVELVCLQCGNRTFLDSGNAFWSAQADAQAAAAGTRRPRI